MPYPFIIPPKRSLGIFEQVGNVLDQRDARAAAAQKAEQTLEDRLAMQQKAQAEMRSRTIEDALHEAQAKALLAPKPSAATMPKLVQGESGEYVPLDPKTGLGPDGKPVKGYRPPAPPPQSSYSFPVVTDENGRQVLAKANTKTGDVTPTEIGAKPSGSQAKLTADQEKSYLFYNLMKNAEPRITAALGSGQIRPAAVQAFLSAGSASEIPVVGKAIGALAKPLANANLNEEEQQMIRAGKDFAAGVLRKESGAAVTNSELYEVMERYFPGMFGDKPGLTNDKGAARREYMQTMEQEAGPAIRFYGQQHSTKPSGGAGHEQLSDEEFARQWQAGKRSWP